MKRFHVHIAVEKLDDSIRFYSSLFGVAPAVVQPDYAKWMLEDPCWRAMKNSKPCAGNWKRQMPACYWVTDPQGVAWETFHILDTIPMFGEDSRAAAVQGACCIPLPQLESQSESSVCCLPLAENAASGPDKACCA